jgi:hypothetical protein
MTLPNRLPLALGVMALLSSSVVARAEDVVRYSLLNGSKFPIARAVEVPANTTLVFHSGMTPSPKDPAAPAGSAAYWGDTKTQALSAFARRREDDGLPGRRSCVDGRAHGFQGIHGRVHPVLRDHGAAESAGAFRRAGCRSCRSGNARRNRGGAGATGQKGAGQVGAHLALMAPPSADGRQRPGGPSTRPASIEEEPHRRAPPRRMPGAIIALTPALLQ